MEILLSITWSVRLMEYRLYHNICRIITIHCISQEQGLPSVPRYVLTESFRYPLARQAAYDQEILGDEASSQTNQNHIILIIIIPTLLVLVRFAFRDSFHSVLLLSI